MLQSDWPKVKPNVKNQNFPKNVAFGECQQATTTTTLDQYLTKIRTNIFILLGLICNYSSSVNRWNTIGGVGGRFDFFEIYSKREEGLSSFP